MTSPTALIPLAKGFEEMEAVILIDVLRRGGIEVTVAGLAGQGPVLGSRGISVVAETDLTDVVAHSFDAVVLPGGLGGTHALRDDERIIRALKRSEAAGRLTAAMCAAPLALVPAGLVHGREMTGHPSVREELRAAGAHLREERVVRDGVLLTSQGPGTAMEFALAIVSDLVGPQTARKVGEAMCFAEPS